MPNKRNNGSADVGKCHSFWSTPYLDASHAHVQLGSSSERWIKNLGANVDRRPATAWIHCAGSATYQVTDAEPEP